MYDYKTRPHLAQRLHQALGYRKQEEFEEFAGES